jgi:hypothetical protein
MFFYIEKRPTNGEGWDNLTLHVSAEDVELDFGFGRQPVLRLIGHHSFIL